MEIVRPIMGVAHWDPAVEIEPEDVTIRFEEGWPTEINGATFESAVDLVIDGGSRSGAPSTVVVVGDHGVEVVREGAIPAADIEAFLGGSP